MMRGFYGSGYDYGYGFGGFGPLMLILLAWSLVWKGFALWKAARKEDNIWFIALLVINTMGILDILYIYIFSTKKAAFTDKLNEKIRKIGKK